MVIAVIAMRVMEVAIDHIIDVIAMRHSFMSTAGAVNMLDLMSFTGVCRRAAIGVVL